MFHIVLFQPEIPPNTGNIIRLCANTGCQLHLIHPLGFSLQEKALRRAGLDYREWAHLREYPDFARFTEANAGIRLFACTTKASQFHSEPAYRSGDGFLFGPETRGLPEDMLESLPNGQKIRVPMRTESRSLNLSNSVAVVAYEALRQTGFDGLV